MTRRRAPGALRDLLKGVEAAESLTDIGALLDLYGESAPFQILHIGVCKIDDILVRDILYTRPLAGAGVAPNDFSDELKTMTVAEALHLMRPYNLLRRNFKTGNTRAFDALRAQVAEFGFDGIFIIPFVYENTVSITIIECPEDYFADNQHRILPDIYQIISTIFLRFPTLGKWPDQFRLTKREAEVLQLASSGHLESAIAKRLGISPNTVRNHMENSKKKLDARNKSHAISLAAKLGEINPLTEQPRRKK